jgi:molybdate transport system permease protein
MTEDYLSPLLISLRTVAVATVITFVVGIAVARWMARYSGRFRGLIDGVFLLPLVLPPTVVGFGLLLLLGKHGPIGKALLSLGTTVVFSWPATVIAAALMSFPLMYMAAKGAFEQVDHNMEDSARTLGASEWRVFRTVTLPLAWPGVAAGTVLSLARSLGEFGATLMLAGNIPGKTATIPVALYFAIQAGDMDQAIKLVAIVLIIAFASLAFIAHWRWKAVKVSNREPAKG